MADQEVKEQQIQEPRDVVEERTVDSNPLQIRRDVQLSQRKVMCCS